MSSADKEDDIEEKIANAVKRVKQDPEAYEGIAEEIEKLGKQEGPHLGPRNDIEFRKLLNEIEESGKDDKK